jgi:hypothetical protein
MNQSLLIERVARIDRQTVVADVAAIALRVVGPFALVAIEAQRLQRAEAERVPIAAVRRVVVSEGRQCDSPLLKAGSAQGLDLELMAGALLPAQYHSRQGRDCAGLAMVAGISENALDVRA